METTSITTIRKPYVIVLMGARRRRPKFLKAYKAPRALTLETLGKDNRGRVIATDRLDQARGFATVAEAEGFMAALPGALMSTWRVALRCEAVAQ